MTLIVLGLALEALQSNAHAYVMAVTKLQLYI